MGGLARAAGELLPLAGEVGDAFWAGRELRHGGSLRRRLASPAGEGVGPRSLWVFAEADLAGL